MPPLWGVNTWHGIKVEELALGKEAFLPFKFLNFSRSAEVQTTEPKKLKRKATKAATNQKSPLHWTAPAVLLSLGTCVVWMDSSTSASSYKVNTLYWRVCTTCKGVDWLPAKFASLFQSPTLLFFLCGAGIYGGGGGFFVLQLLDAFGIVRNTMRIRNVYPSQDDHALPESCPTTGTLLCLPTSPLGPTRPLIPLKVFIMLVKALRVIKQKLTSKQGEDTFGAHLTGLAHTNKEQGHKNKARSRFRRA